MSKLMLLCTCCLMVVPAIWAQAASTTNHGILGYLDPNTGAFRPIPPAAQDDAERGAATTFTGTINLTITITLKTAGLTNVGCSMNVNVTDESGTASPTFYNEFDNVPATGSGTTRTCSLSIPYSWALATQPSDTMTIDYGANGNIQHSTGTTVFITNRNTNRNPLTVLKVPANGATTTLTAAATL